MPTGADAPEWIWDYLGGQAWRPHLIDTQNLTRHDVLRQGVTFAMTDYQGVKFRYNDRSGPTKQPDVGSVETLFFHRDAQAAAPTAAGPSPVPVPVD